MQQDTKKAKKYPSLSHVQDKKNKNTPEGGSWASCHNVMTDGHTEPRCSGEYSSDRHFTRELQRSFSVADPHPTPPHPTSSLPDDLRAGRPTSSWGGAFHTIKCLQLINLPTNTTSQGGSSPSLLVEVHWHSVSFLKLTHLADQEGVMHQEG